MDSSIAEFAVFVLRCLLNYHRRMMAGSEAVSVRPKDNPSEEFRLCDPYEAWAEGLEEAIRCVEIVHAGEITHLQKEDQEAAHQEDRGSS